MNILSAVAPGAKAQRTGHWELAGSFLNWAGVDMQFADPVHGIVLADTISGYLPLSAHHSSAIRTMDAGQTWQVLIADSVGTGNHPPFTRIAVRSFSMPTPRDAYEITDGGSYGHVFATHDGGLHWQDLNTPFSPGVGFIWLRMFERGLGYAIDANRGSGVPVAKTIDSGRYFSGVGFNDPIDSRITDALFLDTTNFWVSYYDGEMLHSTDGGINFKADTVLRGIDTIFVLNTHLSGGVPVVDTTRAFAFGPLAGTADPHRFYASVSRTIPQDTLHFPPFSSTFNTDFVETKDGGKNWEMRSSIGQNRIYRLASPAPDILWAIVGHRPFYYYMGRGNLTGFGCDSLFYSSDDGLTWNKDSTTFSGTNMLEMCWPDATHGYIIASRDTTLLIYRFVQASSVPAVDTSAVPFCVLESPVTSNLIFESRLPTSTEISLVDILGRRFWQSTIPNPGRYSFDVSTLPHGVYSVALESQGRMCSGGQVILIGP